MPDQTRHRLNHSNYTIHLREGGRGGGLSKGASEAGLERECVRISVNENRLHIRNSEHGGLNGFGKLRIVEVISFNKMIHWGPQCVARCNVFYTKSELLLDFYKFI